MVFGEIVTPSSRSLWDDDLAELTPHTSIPIEWEDDNQPFPTDINALIVIDTKPVIDIFKKSVIIDTTPLKRSPQNGLSLYSLNDKIYLLIYEGTSNYSSGEILSDIHDIIDKSNNIYGITSLPIAMYQGSDRLDEESCTVFSLVTEGVQVSYKTLQIPNIITGICANLLTYCLCKDKSCAVFVGYLDASRLDSTNTQNLLQLIRSLGIQNVRGYSLKLETPSNNLYM